MNSRYAPTVKNSSMGKSCHHIDRELGMNNPNGLHLFVVDQDGQMRYKMAGNYSEDNLELVMAEVAKLV
jgi:hypothetical protein